MFYVKTTDNRIVQGDERTLTFLFWDMESEAIDLTGKTVYITVQRYRDGGTVIINNQACSLSADPTDGTVTYDVEAAVTSTWDPGHYFAQFTIEDASTGEIEHSDVVDINIIRDL